MAIETKEALDKKILEQDGEIAALKAKAEGSEKLHEEMEALKKEAKDTREKLAEVTSKNWVEKYSTQNTKEEKLYRFGKYIKAIATKDKAGLEEFGNGGKHLNPNAEQNYGQGEYKVQKADLGTPLYSDATTGSYLVPVEYAAEVMYVAKQASQLMGQVREVPMAGITKYVPVQSDAAAVKWNTLQSSAKSEVNPTFTRATLTSYTGAPCQPRGVLQGHLRRGVRLRVRLPGRARFGQPLHWDAERRDQRARPWHWTEVVPGYWFR
jgi:HK97 family phage major capsid protein